MILDNSFMNVLNKIEKLYYRMKATSFPLIFQKNKISIYREKNLESRNSFFLQENFFSLQKKASPRGQQSRASGNDKQKSKIMSKC